MSDRSQAPNVIGIDLGGTKVLAGVVSPDHKVLGRGKRATPAREGGDAILKAMLDAAHEALAESGQSIDSVACVGVGSPGPLDTEAGVILFSPNLNVRDFPLKASLESALGRPTLVQNDVRVGGYGEFKLGAGRNLKNILAAFVGTGIGGCVIQDGVMLRGATGNAGEVGHVIVKAGGPRCGCGARGCVEALASRTAITRRIRKAIRKGTPTLLSRVLDSDTARLKSKDLSAAVKVGDAVAVHEVQRAAKFLGIALGSLINVLGPEIVIIGGGVTEALGDYWMELVRASTHLHTMADPEHVVRIEQAALGDDAGILGASLLARERFCSA